MTEELIQIVTFYEFKDLSPVGGLPAIKERLKSAMAETGVRGTIILAEEGFNGSVCGLAGEMAAFIPLAEEILCTKLVIKSSFFEKRPLRKIDVKIKPEIVTLKKKVDI